MEQEYPVVPLSVPATDGRGKDPLSSESVRLFVERAGRVRPGYSLSADDAIAVGEICRHLDGLPLGIELAASRVGLFPPRVLAERLTRQLDVPGGGSRDLPARQQTLERTVAWSHDLLDERSGRLLARLSVFAGGFRLEEAEAVGGPDGELGVDVIEGLTTLAGNSLLQPMNGPDIPRFRLLETIRMFAAARLMEADDAELIRRRHAAAYLALAEEAAAHMPGRDQVPWLDRLSTEQDNLRAAIAWAIEAGEAEMAHRLVTASWRFWQFRGHIQEGRARAALVLAMPGAQGTTSWRMRAVEAAGGLEWWGGDVVAADALYQAQVELAQRLEDRRGTADALFNLTHSRFTITSDPDAIADIRAEAVDLYQGLGDDRALARLAFSAVFFLLPLGRIDEAEELARDCLARFVRADDEFYIALTTGSVGGILLMKGDLPGAVPWLIRSLKSNHAMGDVPSLVLALSGVAGVWFLAGFPGDATTIYAAYEGHCRRYGVRPPLDVVGWMGLSEAIDSVRALVAGDQFVEESRRGAAMTPDEVLEFITTEAEPHIRTRSHASQTTS
jgi:predicted ATPase